MAELFVYSEPGLLNDCGMDDLANPAQAPGIALTACENCGTRRTGPFCQQCGQHADTAHHSVRKLLLEAAEHLFNADGKVFSTLRGMLLHPATLTNDYLAGKRAAQVPPVQLYFVMLVVFLFIADHDIHVRFNLRTPEQAARMPQWIRWIDPVSRRVHDNGGDFFGLLSQSAEIFGLLMVPVAALLLWALYAWRGRRLYDHLIFSLHSLSFLYIVGGIGLLIGDRADAFRAFLVVPLAIHLFVHMRGVYGSGTVGTLARMTSLAIGTLIAFIALSVVWVATAYQRVPSPAKPWAGLGIRTGDGSVSLCQGGVTV